jgi:hypothetical protein
MNNQTDILHSVKIDQEGLVSGTQNSGIWAGDEILDTLFWTSTIPASLAPGNYLIRHELIAVHQANNPQCTWCLHLFLAAVLTFYSLPRVLTVDCDWLRLGFALG